MQNPKQLLVASTAGLFFVVVFFYPLFAALDQPWGNYDDIGFSYFMVQNSTTKLLAGDFAHLWDTRMFYPVQQSGALGNSVIGQGILAIPWYLLTHNIITATNLMILAGFFLSFLAMYLLVYEVVGGVIASVIGALIFTYSPVIMGFFPISVLYLTTLWIPLIFWAFERYLKIPRIRYAVGLAIFFLMQLISSVYYVMFIAIFLPIYGAIRIVGGRMQLKKILRPWTIAIFVVTAALSYLYIQPNLAAQKQYGVLWPRVYVEQRSASTGDYLSVRRSNMFLGAVLPHSSVSEVEHSLYPGLIAMLLGFCALALYRRASGHQKVFLVAWGVILVTSFLLSLGPRISILYNPFVLIFPWFGSIRMLTRYAIFVQLSLGIIAALGWTAIAARIRKRWIIAVGCILIVCVTAEYLQHTPKPTPVAVETIAAYTWLDKQKDIDVILEFPMADNYIRGYPDETIYLLYGTYHHKKIVNGSTAVNPDAFTSLGVSLMQRLPTDEALNLLYDIGAHAIVIHEDESRGFAAARRLQVELKARGIREVFVSGPVHIFRL